MLCKIQNSAHKTSLLLLVVVAAAAAVAVVFLKVGKNNQGDRISVLSVVLTVLKHKCFFQWEFLKVWK